MLQESYKSSSEQTVFDIALTTYGSMEGVIDLLVLNSIDFDSAIPSSITYHVQENYIVKYLKGYTVTTGGETLVTTPVTLPYFNSGKGDMEESVIQPSLFKKYQIKAEQNIFDIACMVTGSIEGVIDLLLLNNLSFDSPILPGNSVKHEDELYIKDDITTGGINYNIKPAGAFSDAFSEAYQ